MSTTTATSAVRRASAHDRCGLRAVAARVPGHLDLEDPVPRGPGAADAEAHPRRLPAVQRGGRRAAGDDPEAAARRVSAAARDQAGARVGRRGASASGAAPPGSASKRRSSTSPSCAIAPGSTQRWHARSRSTACSHRASKVGSISIARATPRSRPPAGGSPSTGSTRGTFAPSATRRDARRGCWSSSSRRRYGRATPSAARPGSTTCSRSPRRRRSSRGFSSGASCGCSRSADDRASGRRSICATASATCRTFPSPGSSSRT